MVFLVCPDPARFDHRRRRPSRRSGCRRRRRRYRGSPPGQPDHSPGGAAASFLDNPQAFDALNWCSFKKFWPFLSFHLPMQCLISHWVILAVTITLFSVISSQSQGNKFYWQRLLYHSALNSFLFPVPVIQVSDLLVSDNSSIQRGFILIISFFSLSSIFYVFQVSDVWHRTRLTLSAFF